jgi:hypothetical protein
LREIERRRKKENTMAITAEDKFLVHAPFPLPQSFHDAVAKRFPQLRVRFELAKLEGGRLATADSLSDEAWDGVTLLCVMPPPSAEKMKNIKFVHLLSAGSDLWLEHEVFLNKEVAFCSTSGVHA